MGGYIFYFMFFSAPVAAIIFFVVSLVSFITAKSANRRTPEKYSESQIKTRLLLLIISAVVAAVILAVVITLVALVYMALAYM